MRSYGSFKNLACKQYGHGYNVGWDYQQRSQEWASWRAHSKGFLWWELYRILPIGLLELQKQDRDLSIKIGPNCRWVVQNRNPYCILRHKSIAELINRISSGCIRKKQASTSWSREKLDWLCEYNDTYNRVTRIHLLHNWWILVLILNMRWKLERSEGRVWWLYVGHFCLRNRTNIYRLGSGYLCCNKG